MTKDNQSPSVFASIMVFIITIIILAFMLELFLVIKNRDCKNYDIEMWKYSRQLKQVSTDPKIGHEHKPNSSAKLQNIDIKINSLGMRGEDVQVTPKTYKILMLGSSITFGWGVENIYPRILEAQLNRYLEVSPSAAFENVVVYNAGVGNYNSEREIEAFLTKYQSLNPDLIILNSFVRDAELIPSPKHNWLLENSQLAVTLWSRIEQFKRKFGVEKNFEEHYQEIYQDDYPGWKNMQTSFTRLADFARVHNKQVLVTMIPDIHNLKNYPFVFIHEKTQKLAYANGFQFLDFYDCFTDFASEPESVWAMPGDPHPNSRGHKLMADKLYNQVKNLL